MEVNEHNLQPSCPKTVVYGWLLLEPDIGLKWPVDTAGAFVTRGFLGVFAYDPLLFTDLTFIAGTP